MKVFRGPKQNCTTNELNIFAFSSSSKNAEEEDKMLSVKSGITNILMTCPVDDKFVTMVKEQLAGSDDWDLGQLYATLNTSDR